MFLINKLKYDSTNIKTNINKQQQILFIFYIYNVCIIISFIIIHFYLLFIFDFFKVVMFQNKNYRIKVSYIGYFKKDKLTF